MSRVMLVCAASYPVVCVLLVGCVFESFFFFKQKTAYEMRISDWSSDVCSSDLPDPVMARRIVGVALRLLAGIALLGGGYHYGARQTVANMADRKSVV